MDYFIIPARSGSKRVLAKNFRPFADTSLIEITINLAREFCAPIIISTDSPQLVEKYRGVEVTILNRSEATSSDDATAEEVILEVIEQCNLTETDRLIYLQPTSPMRSVESLKDALIQSKEFPDAIFLSVTELDAELWMDVPSHLITRVGPLLGDDYNNRDSQKRTPLYKENGNFYIIPVSTFNRLEKLSDAQCRKYITGVDEDCDINTEREFSTAESLFLASRNRKR